jgi:hypothetical protein
MLSCPTKLKITRRSLESPAPTGHPRGARLSELFIGHLRGQHAVERVKAGTPRALGMNSGRTIGRPPVVLDRVRLAVLCNAGESWLTIAAQLG